MALDDRDYMRERRESEKVLHFRPAPQKVSVLTIALCVVAALYVLYQGALWWQNKQLQTKLPPAPSIASPSLRPLKSDLPRVQEPKPQSAAQTLPNQPPAPGTVNKCVVNGNVTYSDAACPKEAVVRSVKLPPPPDVDPYHVPRAVSAPNIALQQTGASPEPQPTFHDASQLAPAKSAECKHLDELVKQIDIRALQSQSLQLQDLLRADRKKARDRQFFLGC